MTANEGEDEYEVEADALTVDEIVNDMEELILANTGNSVTLNTPTYPTDYDSASYKVNGEVDYGKFVYRTGKVNFSAAVANSDYFNEKSEYYKTIAAVNEIMFAYSTDPGCLNSYMGYAVSPYGTDFVPEFEYAAQKVVEDGVGSYMVCATDYGWHIVFCTFKYNVNGATYNAYKHSEAVGDAKVEGSFSNLYYESLKSTAVSNYTTELQSTVLNTYDNDASVTRYQSRYQDLLEIDK